MGFFFAVVLLVYNLVLFYIGWNGWKWIQTIIGDRKRVKYTYWLVLILFAYTFVFARFLDDIPVLTWLGGIWLGLFFYLVLLLPFVNLFVFLTRFTRVPKEKAKKWAGFSTIIIIIGLFVLGIYNAFTPVVNTYQITIPKQVEGAKSINFVMASDMHFSEMSGASHARNLVREINALKPDLVLFPGDIIDDDIGPFLRKGIPDIIKEIEAPVYASFGNHDREDPDVDLVNIFNNSGMKLLADEVTVLDNGITLVGRKDRGYQDVVRLKLADLMKHVDKTKPVILLDHQPYDLDIAVKNGVDLMVSGHTHRGQMAPGNLVTDMLFENDFGYLKKGQMHSIVSSGYGFWGTPLRIGTQAEIVQIKITFK
ncbi:metallophosphoesterase [Neobacillus niacini]|uniref:metallophosphoesterase n=1 Tax=Neobacillus niacini TaxID=86668 RepID=UPI0021CB09C0|nr:metallophosphoesterase [Neobacillus niacini]MCM3764685.1 metallophosphoesterase [Neobacillus niacini]